MECAATLFVYGTLKRGCRNWSVLKAAVYLGEARTEPAYRMYNCGAYPGLVEADGGEGQAIHGELYRVDERLLAELDGFEDAPNEYVRGPVALEGGATAQTYFYRLGTAHLRLCGAVWSEG